MSNSKREQKTLNFDTHANFIRLHLNFNISTTRISFPIILRVSLSFDIHIHAMSRQMLVRQIARVARLLVKRKDVGRG